MTLATSSSFLGNMHACPACIVFVTDSFQHKLFYVRFLKASFCCFSHLLVNPKERRVVVVESVFCPTTFRDTLAKVLFDHYEVPSVLFAPSHLAVLFTLGIPSGLVIDVGQKETQVLPVSFQSYYLIDASLCCILLNTYSCPV